MTTTKGELYMNVVAIIFGVILTLGLVVLLGFQVYNLVKAVKNRKKIREEEISRKEKCD